MSRGIPRSSLGGAKAVGGDSSLFIDMPRRLKSLAALEALCRPSSPVASPLEPVFRAASNRRAMRVGGAKLTDAAEERVPPARAPRRRRSPDDCCAAAPQTTTTTTNGGGAVDTALTESAEYQKYKARVLAMFSRNPMPL